MAQDTKLIDSVVDAAMKHGDRNIIVLSGPPATGKSHTAREAALLITGHEAFVREIQFHPNFTYETLMEGYRPTADAGFLPEAGVLKQWSDAADADENPEQKYVLLIEELSRANVPAVLGELMTYIEHRDRRVWLPILRQDFAVSKRLIILATMNPRDRSALELDDAVYRRLRVLDSPPRADLINAIFPVDFEPADRRDAVVDALCQVFLKCAADFPVQYETSMPFGHAEFSHVRGVGDLDDLWRQQLKYLLYRPGMSAHPFSDVIEAAFANVLAAAASIEVVADGVSSTD